MEDNITSIKVLNGFVSSDGISKKFRDRVLFEYSRPADIKKIAAGRGPIRGFSEDFAGDRSKKSILSHFMGELSPADRRIGAMAFFGQIGTLYPNREINSRELQQNYACVPGILRKNRRLLTQLLIVSGAVVEPGDGAERIITSGGQLNSHLILPLSGRLRGSHGVCKTDVCNFILPGKLVRDIPALGWTLAEL